MEDGCGVGRMGVSCALRTIDDMHHHVSSVTQIHCKITYFRLCQKGHNLVTRIICKIIFFL